jgi:polyhydroxyalkanoate synthesis repressor PhaR
MPEQKDDAKSPAITIKKYANRRLYNTATSRYVTLDHLAEMVKEGAVFVVTDAKTGRDTTRSVLTQIIVEQEAKGQNLLPIKFLRQVIGFYGDSLGGVLPRYLEQSMDSFAQNEAQIRDVMQNTFKGLVPMERMEEMGKQNMALFENAMRVFNPIAQADNTGAANHEPIQSTPDPSKGEDIDDLKKQLNAMQAQLAKLAKGQD